MAGLGRVFEGLKRPQIRGPLSVNLEAAQGMIDRVHSAANAQVASIVNVDEGIEGLGNFTGPWTKIMAKIAQAKGWSLSDWRTLVQKESGGNPNARNPSSGAYGLGQFLRRYRSVLREVRSALVGWVGSDPRDGAVHLRSLRHA